MSKLKTVALASLVEDFALYPRHQVDDVHVGDMVHAIQAGVALPRIIAEESNLRVIDGFHRLRALRKVHGDDAKIQVELRTYDSETDLFLDAARLNAGHGRKLNRVDQVRIVVRARELGADDEQVAAALAVPAERVEILAVRVASTPAGDSMALKHGAGHLAGRMLTDDQVSALRRMRGVRTSRLVGELRMLLESGVANLDDPGIREQLQALAVLINSKVGEVAEIA